MLEKIKSIFFIKKLLFQLDTKRKLVLFRYNKHLQNFINVNFNHYKIVSGKYILYEDKEKRKAKEYLYFNDRRIFEGEYFQGKRHGKGKEYNANNELIYEGEYSKGKKHGLGKEYDNFGQLIFEGEYLYGKKWNGILKFQHNDYSIKNGKGIIKEYIEDNLIYEGEYNNGEKNGKCKLHFIDGKLLFEGEYLNGKIWNGNGYINKHLYEMKNGNLSIQEFNNKGKLIFSLEYLRGEKNGKWKKLDDTGKLIFETNYLNGKKNGKSIEYEMDQLNFVGEYLNGLRVRGREYIEGKLNYEGEYLYGIYWNGKGYDENGKLVYEMINGKGTVRIDYLYHRIIVLVGCLYGKINNKIKVFQNNYGTLIYEFDFIIEKNSFRGKQYDLNGRLHFEGEYFNSEKKGKVKEYNTQNGVLIFDGEFSNGKRNGKCKEYNKLNGELIYEGEYINGRRIDIYTACEFYILIIILLLNRKNLNLKK